MIDDSTSNRPTDRQAEPDSAAPEESRLPRPSPVSVATDISDSLRTPRSAYWILTAILLLFAVVSTIGITWGLPSRRIDQYLFADGAVWSGEKIYRLAHADEKFGGDRGADVDADPIQKNADEPVLLTGTDEDIAKIYLRYRLYTHQPDEMITMMALAGMRPSRLDFDPKLYQYGGLFIYPVGALIRLCGYAGLIDVRGDVVFYLDNPDEFGKFYVVARAYSAMWGLVGVVVVFAIARRLKDAKSGLLAALLFTLMPVVVCMAHEGKPHLPGAVLMLAAVLFAMRHLSAHATASALPRAAGFSPRDGSDAYPASGFSPRDGSDARGAADVSPRRQEPSARRDWWAMCACCGAALGMVLSSLPVFILIPLVALLEARKRTRVEGRQNARYSITFVAKRAFAGVGAASLVYLVTNPYIVINGLTNREVLKSNFGNSLEMYAVARIGEGFVRVIELTIEGATLPVLVLGAVALVVAAVRSMGPSQRQSRSGDERSRGLKHAARVGRSHWLKRVVQFGRSRGLKPAARGGDGETVRRAGNVDGGWAGWLPLAVVALVFFAQFVLIGAGKPAEYGRFGIFTNTALAIGAACMLVRRWTRFRAVVNWMPASFVALWAAYFGSMYLRNFHEDSTYGYSRVRLASLLPRIAQFPMKDGGDWSRGKPNTILVRAEPAPYSLPPLDFRRFRVLLCKTEADSLSATVHPLTPQVIPADTGPALWLNFGRHVSCIGRDLFPTMPMSNKCAEGEESVLLGPSSEPFEPRGLDRLLQRPSPISWANKPFVVVTPREIEWRKRNGTDRVDPENEDP